MPAIAAPADKRFRRAQFKPARKRRLGVRQVWLVAKIAAVLGVTLYGGWVGTALLLGSPALHVSRIVVRGNERLSTGEVLAIVDGLQGRNILAVELDEWRDRLLASPWVEEATLRRVLPSRIDIMVRERKPIGLGRMTGTLYLVDANGVVIDEYGPHHASYDLPIIDGLAKPSNTREAVVVEERMKLAVLVISALNTRPDLAARVSQVDVSDHHNAVVMLEGDTVMLRLGEEQFVDRIEDYLDVAPVLHERVASIDYVDMRFGERLYVRPVGRTKRR
ncbi:MAG: cell division protein FtsQ/DivIB [Acidobacteriota bacterium]